MKKEKNTKQRLFEVMSKVDPSFKKRKLNENDEWDSGLESYENQNPTKYYDLKKEIEKRLDTSLIPYDDGEYEIPTKTDDIILILKPNDVELYYNDDLLYQSKDSEDYHIEDIYHALKPYEDIILKGDDAYKALHDYNAQMMKDRLYSKKERNAEFYGNARINGEEIGSSDPDDLW